jgi:hypothetical protein
MGFSPVVVELKYCNNLKRKRKKDKEKGGGKKLSDTECDTVSHRMSMFCDTYIYGHRV